MIRAGGVDCRRCGLPIPAEDADTQRWHAGHGIDRALGGSDDLAGMWPEHASCNTSAGGRLAAQLQVGAHAPRRTNARAPRVAPPAVPVVKRRAW
jgi:hypothetical protein